MLEKIKQHFAVATWLLWLSIRKQVEWILTLISFAIALPIKCATGLVLIYVLVDKFSPLYGWSFNQLVFLYGLSYVSDGLASTFASQARRIEIYVTRGDFDRSLVRPISVLFQFLFRFIFLGGVMEVISGLIVLIYGYRLSGFSLTFVNIVKIAVVILGATLIRVAYLIIVGSIAFWTKRSGPIVWVWDEIVRRTTQYPITMYPQIFQALFTFILPFSFISYYPCCDFYGFKSQFDLPLNFVFWTPVIGIFTFILANKIFNYGLKVYESAGA